MNPQEVFCPNMACPARGQLGQGNVIGHGRTRRRYRCTVCRKTFSPRTGTLFHRRHTAIRLMVQIITLVSYGCPLAAIEAAFGIQARTVRPSAGGEVQQADHGHTMVYSTSDRVNEQLAEARVARAGRGVVLFNGKRFMVGAGGAVLGRSRECEVVLDDSNVSRKHAEIRPGPHGWTVADLGSTNGTRVNGRTVSSGAHPLEAGDRLELGTAVATFETE